MPISADKQIIVDGIIFSLNELRANADKYLPMITPMFRAATLRQKDREDTAAYLGRLFYLCYYKKGLAADSNQAQRRTRTPRERVPRTTRSIAANQIAAESSSILNALGIDVIKYNPTISRIMFKNSGNQYKIKNSEMDSLIESIKSKPNFKRNKLNVKIGVELEFIGRRGHVDTFNSRMRDLVGDRYECALRYIHNDGNKWILGTDGSLRYTNSGERGYELTSPILDPDSKSDMEELKNVTNLVQEIFSAYTNRSCGTHIHMSFNTGLLTKEHKRELKKFLAASYEKNEDTVFDKVVPNCRRGNHSRWCRRVSVWDTQDRYRKINFQNDDYTKPENMHLEFRQLDGTLDFAKIHSWIKLQRMFVELTVGSFNKKDNYEENSIREYTIEAALTDKTFNTVDVEYLLKEGKLIA